MIRRRGRRKKSDIVNFSITETGDNTVFFNSEDSKEKTTREQESISFGELSIVIHAAKQTEIPSTLFDTVVNSSVFLPSNENDTMERLNSTEIMSQSTLQNTEEIESLRCKIDTNLSSKYPQIPSEYLQQSKIEAKTPRNKKQQRPETSPKNTSQKQCNNLKYLTRYNKDNTETVLPLKTDIWCWWCCHPFHTQPTYIPERYDNIKDVFDLKGNFCSWNCAKTYIFAQKTVKTTFKCSLLALLRKKLQGNFGDPIRPAPPREMLTVFGGDMTIEEFRNSNVCSFEPKTKGLVRMINRDEEWELFKQRRVKYVD